MFARTLEGLGELVDFQELLGSGGGCPPVGYEHPCWCLALGQRQQIVFQRVVVVPLRVGALPPLLVIVLPFASRPLLFVLL